MEELNPQQRQELLQNARRAYYNLHQLGLKSFSCQVSVDWDEMFKGLPLDEIGRNQLLPVLKQAQFRIVVGPTGASNLSYESNAAPNSEEVASRLRKSVDGFNQMITGSLQTWSSFVIGSFFEDPVETIEKSGGTLTISEQNPLMKAVIILNSELLIQHTEVESTSVNGSVNPKFTPVKGGLLLTGYTSEVKTAGTQTQGMAAQIAYRVSMN